MKKKEQFTLCNTSLSALRTSKMQAQNINQQLSLFIPRVFPNIDLERFQKIFRELKLGDVESITRVAQYDHIGKLYYRVNVYFSCWYCNDAVKNFQAKVVSPYKQARLVYDDPWYWIILENQVSQPIAIVSDDEEEEYDDYEELDEEEQLDEEAEELYYDRGAIEVLENDLNELHWEISELNDELEEKRSKVNELEREKEAMRKQMNDLEYHLRKTKDKLEYEEYVMNEERQIMYSAIRGERDRADTNAKTIAQQQKEIQVLQEELSKGFKVVAVGTPVMESAMHHWFQ